MSAAAPSASSLIQQRPFVLFWLARLAATMGYQMLALTIGWQIYEITNSAFDLGLVGLIQFIPAVVLTLLIGHAADRYDRRLIVRVAQSVYVLAALIITVALIAGLLSRDLLFVAVFMIGCARAFEMPTAHSLAPALVPAPMVSRAVAAWTSANQIAVISGPALGGLIYTVSPVLVGVLCLVFFTTSITLISFVHVKGPAPNREPPTFASVLAGFEYVRTRKRLLGVITLDFVRRDAWRRYRAAADLCQGYSGCRADRAWAAALGAGRRRADHRHLLVAASGRAAYRTSRCSPWSRSTASLTIVFGLSTWFPLSLLALACLGASDALSVVIRFSLVQIETPDEKRGRVSAINYLLVGSSNTLGEFESGMVAGWLGAVPSVLIGGIGSLLVAATWMGLFPDLRRIDRFEPADKG